MLRTLLWGAGCLIALPALLSVARLVALRVCEARERRRERRLRLAGV